MTDTVKCCWIYCRWIFSTLENWTKTASRTGLLVRFRTFNISVFVGCQLHWFKVHPLKYDPIKCFEKLIKVSMFGIFLVYSKWKFTGNKTIDWLLHICGPFEIKHVISIAVNTHRHKRRSKIQSWMLFCFLRRSSFASNNNKNSWTMCLERLKCVLVKRCRSHNNS